MNRAISKNSLDSPIFNFKAFNGCKYIMFYDKQFGNKLDQ